MQPRMSHTKTMSATRRQVTDARDIRDSALQALSGVQNSQKLGFIELALMGKKVSFDKVIKMMDDMVVLLGEEQMPMSTTSFV